jgi:hypothetical protein
MDVESLYGAPLERFVAERDELVRTLRKQGEREEAAKVAKLRKPSVAAWAVNQLVRTQSQSVAELFDAGDALRDAHRTATAGRGDGGTLRAASQRERSAVDALLEAARGLLTSQGHELSPTIIDRVAETLRAAALDPDSRELVGGGRLERELRHVGLGVGLAAGAGAAPAAPPRRQEAGSEPGARSTPRASATKKRPPAVREASAPRPAERRGERAEAARREERGEAERRVERAEAERLRRERAQALKAAREIEAKARRRAERTTRAVRVAQERRDRAAEDLQDADATLAAAKAEAEAAVAEHDRIHERLERL